MSGHKNFKDLAAQVDADPERRARVDQIEEEIDHYLHEVNRARGKITELAIKRLKLEREWDSQYGNSQRWLHARSLYFANLKLTRAIEEYQELIKDEEK